MEGRQRTTRWTDKDGVEQRGLEIRIDELKMLRRAPKADPVVAAAKGMASIETLLKDFGAGTRDDFSLADLAGMLNKVRTNLVGEDDKKSAVREKTAHRVAA